MHLSEGNTSVNKRMFPKMAVYSASSSNIYEADISENNFKIV